ncbi:MAG TPA: hypothetical protein VF609_01470, partial [Flavisolibacter sp.]
MKRLFFCLLFGFFSLFLHAQIVTDTVHRLFRGEVDGDAIWAHFGEGNSHFLYNSKYGPYISTFVTASLVISPHWRVKKKIKELLADSTFRRGRLNYTAMVSFDSAAVVCTVHHINRQNASEFEFRVLENKQKEVLSWSAIKFFCETYGQVSDSVGKEEQEMAYLGEFKTSFGND